MKILVTNDDGIYAPGIIKLAEIAAKFGDVYVVAPGRQCSAMSHSITIRADVKVTKLDGHPSGAQAYAVDGTPADCVKIGAEFLLKEKPDIVFSGINNGYNAGIDTAYSATVAAAMEAILKGIPAIAFSTSFDDDYRLVDRELPGIIEKLLRSPAGKGKIWNVNFPGCGPDACRGILWDRSVAKIQFFPDVYSVVAEEGDSRILTLSAPCIDDCDEGTDMHALLHGYISVGTITNMIMGV